MVKDKLVTTELLQYFYEQIKDKLSSVTIDGDISAENVLFDNAISGLNSTNMQDVVNELVNKINNSSGGGSGDVDLSGLILTVRQIDSNYYLYLIDSEGKEITSTLLPATGGTAVGTTMKLKNLLDYTAFIAPYTYDGTCKAVLRYNFTSVDGDGDETGSGVAVYTVNDVVKYTQNITQGDRSFDIGEYLVAGKTNTVKVTVTDTEGNSKSITYSISVTYNYIESSFEKITKQTGSFSVAYTPVGSGTKTIHFIVDGEEIATKETTVSNREQYQTIPVLEHGTHKLEIYMTTVLDGYEEVITSNTLEFGIVAIDEISDEAIVYVDNISTNILQYSNVSIPFLIYDPTTTVCDVECYYDEQLITTLTVGSEVNTWNYTVMTSGNHTFKLKYGEIEKVIDVLASKVDVAQAETSGLKFYFNALNRNNSEANPARYSYTNEDNETYTMTFNNVNFVENGWTGNSLDIGVGASVDVDICPFATDVTSTVGKTIEFGFKVKNVYNYDSMVISCFANEKGINITPNRGSLSINSNDVVEVQFKDEEEVKLSFVVSQRNSANDGQRQLIYVYINSDIAGVLKYSINDNFMQLDAANIHIGSDEAGIELYNIRVYEVALSSYQILDNYIADASEPLLMIERNNRNDIFDSNNEVDIDKLPDDCPYLIISCPELPQYKDDKKKNVSGRFVDKLNPSKSFTFTGAEFDVQGTSSAGYYVKNFKGKFKGGFTNNDGVTSEGYAIHDDSIPVSTFCFKADVASSEGANNVMLMELWEQTVPYKTLPQETDSRVRYTIDSRPIVLYWENTTTGELHFRGKYNFNNDKSTEETFGFADDDEHTVQCVEFKDNGLELTEFRGDDFDSEVTNEKGETYPVWEDSFEFRFPDKFKDVTRLKRVVSWVVSTDTSAATNEALNESVTYGDVTYTVDSAEYRLAKFKYEFEDYFIKTPTLYYYLFTDLFLMVDSRAKNQFITTFDGIHWLFLPYDGDTALGTDNIGALKFGYWLEDTDKVNGTDVYNGQKSVLWINVKKCFASEIAELAQDVMSEGVLTYENVRDLFNKHQSAWSEAIFCADTNVKYIQPYLETGTLAYLDMAQGSKRTQRDYWLYNRFAYWCSKFHVGTAKNEFITLRMSEPSGDTVNVVPLDMTLNITPYSHTYVNVSFGQAVQSVRGYANEVTTVYSGLDRPSDSPVYIFNAAHIKDIGDLSPAYVKYCDVSAAKNLENLVIGNPAEGYYNEALTTLGLGNNSKLKKIDVRNCTNLTGSISAQSCKNIKEIYATGSKITSVSLPTSSFIHTLQLPSTIVALNLNKQEQLTNFSMEGYDNLTSLYMVGCRNVDVVELLNNATNLTNVYLSDLDLTLYDTELLDRLLSLGGKSENGEENTTQSVLKGTVVLECALTSSKYQEYKSVWKDLNIICDSMIPTYVVTFVNYDGTVLYEEVIENGGYAIEPISAGYIDVPTREMSVDTIYTYSQWDNPLTSKVIRDMTVTAQYSTTVRQYTVKYYVDGELMQETVSDVYSDVPYVGELPRQTINHFFYGWDCEAKNIMSDVVCTAKFKVATVPANIVDVTKYDYVYSNNSAHTSAYTLSELFAICKSDSYKEYLAIGDEVEIVLNTNETLIFQVYDFNHYDSAEVADMSHVLFGLKHLLQDGRIYNEEVAAWNESDIREWLNSELINDIPIDVRGVIENVYTLSNLETEEGSYIHENELVCSDNVITGDSIYIQNRHTIKVNCIDGQYISDEINLNDYAIITEIKEV